MRSLNSIIVKLSVPEVESFRAFLKGQSRCRGRKKLDLLDQILSGKSDEALINAESVSRQSVYQLKKRLQDDLYSFLVLQEQEGKATDPLFIEMDCHKKLYCFKILFDKGIHDHAAQILEEVIDIANQHNIDSVYLEAVNIRNACFVSAPVSLKKNAPINSRIKKLRNTLGCGLYINHYITETEKALLDPENVFRERLIARFANFELTRSGNIIDQLALVNQLFLKHDYGLVVTRLTDLLNQPSVQTEDPRIIGLIHIEITKAYVCLSRLDLASDHLQSAQLFLSGAESFVIVFAQLRFIICLREDLFVKAGEICDEISLRRAISGNELRKGRWAMNALCLYLAQGGYREVIKRINGYAMSILKSRKWLCTMRALELICIYQLGDHDWLQYKIENFRKSFGTTSDSSLLRVAGMVGLLRQQVTDSLSHSQMIRLVVDFESCHSWDPLGMEVINLAAFCVPRMVQIRVGNSPLESKGDKLRVAQW